MRKKGWNMRNTYFYFISTKNLLKKFNFSKKKDRNKRFTIIWVIDILIFWPNLFLQPFYKHQITKNLCFVKKYYKPNIKCWKTTKDQLLKPLKTLL